MQLDKKQDEKGAMVTVSAEDFRYLQNRVTVLEKQIIFLVTHIGINPDLLPQDDNLSASK